MTPKHCVAGRSLKSSIRFSLWESRLPRRWTCCPRRRHHSPRHQTGEYIRHPTRSCQGPRLLGLAKVKGKTAETAETLAADSGPQHLTSPETMLARSRICRPSRSAARELDSRDLDLFSFGAVLEEMATGKMPFEGLRPARFAAPTSPPFAFWIRKRSNSRPRPSSAQESLQIFTQRWTSVARILICRVLTAQTIALQNERNDVDILRRRMDASVLLIKALGGGWDVSQLPKTAQLR